MKLTTEEDVKNKLILPFLKDLGFQEEELYFERNFNLILGRYSYKVETGQQYQNAEGRLDILIKYNNKNLFIIEVKRDSLKISDRDIDQAISYARLLHEIAPFSIVTNGIDFLIYDSISKEKLNKHKFTIKGHYELSISEEIEYRYEALKHFLGYSKENLLTFCQEQVQERMITLLGSKSDPTKKYIPEIYIPRKRLVEAFTGFLSNATFPAFAIIGDSGTGKTCSMCSMALESLQNGLPVLFYKASNLIGGIEKSIADDFNWIFSPQFSDIQIFKRVEELFESAKLIIFIDAIDEWTLPNKVEIINNFVSKIRNRKFKLVLSCKTKAWSDFLLQKDTPTELSEYLYLKNEKEKGYYFDEFDGEEFSKAVMKYRKFYQYNGFFEKRVYEECRRIPFILRVCFEVAQEHKLKHLTFSCKEFFDEYYKRMLNKIENTQVAEATIKGVAKCLFKNNSDSIDIDILRNSLGLKINDILMPSLFDYNVLEIMPGENNTKIKFYFDKFRDYIIAFHVLKLAENPEPFAKLSYDGVHKEVMNFFYPFTDINQKKTIDNLIRENAERYLEFYNEVIKINFPELRNRFSPFTEGDIGLIGELNIPEKKLMMYGFRSLDDSDEERIKIVPWDKEYHYNPSNLPYLHGARTLHRTSSADFFREIDISKEVLKSEIEPQLKEIIKKGILNERNNKYLLIEKVIAIVMGYQSKQLGIKDKRKLSKYLPLTFEDIEYVLLYDKASRFYEDKLVQEKIDRGEIKQEWKGSTVSYHHSLSLEDSDFIHQKAELAAKNKINVNPEARSVPFSDMEKTLLEAMQHLREQGINSIGELILPEKDRFSSSGWDWAKYSDERLADYLIQINSIFLDEYKKLIETNFPNMKGYFKLYSLMPIKRLFIIKKGTGWVMTYLCQNKESENNEVITVKEDEINFDDNSWKIFYSGKEYNLIHYSHSDISKYFGGFQNNYIHVQKISTSFIPIRNLVYNQINKEIDKVLNHLFEKYGIARK
jgi:hypothetical protein